MQYDLESNIISIEIAKGKMDHCIAMGNFLVHMNKQKTPLLIEILDGGKFISQMKKINSTKTQSIQNIINAKQ